MARTIQQAISFQVPPQRLYRLYLSSREHAVACGGWGTSKIDARVGGRMAMAPHIRGRFLWLVPGRMIVQTWRTANWKKADADSILTLTFHPERKGSRVVMVHANVPDAHGTCGAALTSESGRFASPDMGFWLAQAEAPLPHR